MEQKNSDDYQADAGAPALSEKFIARSEWLPIESAPKDGRYIMFGQERVRWNDASCPACFGFWNGDSLRWADAYGMTIVKEHWPFWMPLPSPPGAELNFSKESESDAVSLKSDTSLKDSEA